MALTFPKCWRIFHRFRRCAPHLQLTEYLILTCFSFPKGFIMAGIRYNASYTKVPIKMPACFKRGILFILCLLKSLLQYHSSKASILQCSAFLVVQLSQLYITTGKTLVLIFLSLNRRILWLTLSLVSINISSKLKGERKNLVLTWVFTGNDAYNWSPRQVTKMTLAIPHQAVSAASFQRIIALHVGDSLREEVACCYGPEGQTAS